MYLRKQQSKGGAAELRRLSSDTAPRQRNRCNHALTFVISIKRNPWAIPCGGSDDTIATTIIKDTIEINAIFIVSFVVNHVLTRTRRSGEKSNSAAPFAAAQQPLCHCFTIALPLFPHHSAFIIFKNASTTTGSNRFPASLCICPLIIW